MLYRLFIFLIAVIAFLSIYTTLAEANQVEVKTQVKTQIEYNNEFNRIALCESGGNLRAKNKKGSASGEFQFINQTWYDYGRELWGDEFYEKNIWTSDNRELAWYVYQKYGSKDWNASKHCWSK